MEMNPDKLRKRFHDLRAKRDAVRAKADPIRAERDKLVARQLRELEKADQKVAAAEKGLYDIEMEMGMINRALGGRTGEQEA